MIQSIYDFIINFYYKFQDLFDAMIVILLIILFWSPFIIFALIYGK